MQCICFLLFSLVIFTQNAYAEVQRLAVLEFRGIGVRDVGLLASLSDGIRSGLIKSVHTDQFLVMTQESTLQILKDQGKDASCIEGECEVEVARNIGADFVISGTITKISERYVVTIKLHDTQTSALLASEQINDADPLQLIEKMVVEGQKLLMEG